MEWTSTAKGIILFRSCSEETNRKVVEMFRNFYGKDNYQYYTHLVLDEMVVNTIEQILHPTIYEWEIPFTGIGCWDYSHNIYQVEKDFSRIFQYRKSPIKDAFEIEYDYTDVSEEFNYTHKKRYCLEYSPSCSAFPVRLNELARRTKTKGEYVQDNERRNNE